MLLSMTSVLEKKAVSLGAHKGLKMPCPKFVYAVHNAINRVFHQCFQETH